MLSAGSFDAPKFPRGWIDVSSAGRFEELVEVGRWLIGWNG